MNTPERVLLLSLHPQFAKAILDGSKTVELRRQRVAVPPETPLIIYATSPVMALLGTARVAEVDTATPAQVWRRHRNACGITKAEYAAYMDGSTQASALLLDSPRYLAAPVRLEYLRRSGTFHPPQSYRYLTQEALSTLVAGHEAADQLLTHLNGPVRPKSAPSPAHTLTCQTSLPFRALNTKHPTSLVGTAPPA